MPICGGRALMSRRGACTLGAFVEAGSLCSVREGRKVAERDTKPIPAPRQLSKPGDHADELRADHRARFWLLVLLVLAAVIYLAVRLFSWDINRDEPTIEGNSAGSIPPSHL